ncbi:hypothetical protein HYFRA_00002191 [Hymenoscyphus fraxineus]|uniref:2EXR domain-containing protein n=1 Tax=Hymenoscyphus fraxineus TaxID=746836 RepID=A0A9N9KP56_9HELO|nr:hypothetical protein HYFRA_00002191 [Hymenoscyphus fraxineus]
MTIMTEGNQTVPLKEFHLFPNLLKELRCLIWSMVPRCGRIIQVHFLFDKNKWGAETDSATLLDLVPTLVVSREARNETMRAYTKAFGTIIDLEKDTLFISDCMFTYRKTGRMLLDMEYIGQVRNLALREDVVGMLLYLERATHCMDLSDTLFQVLWKFKKLGHFSIVLTPTDNISACSDNVGAEAESMTRGPVEDDQWYKEFRLNVIDGQSDDVLHDEDYWDNFFDKYWLYLFDDENYVELDEPSLEEFRRYHVKIEKRMFKLHKRDSERASTELRHTRRPVYPPCAYQYHGRKSQGPRSLRLVIRKLFQHGKRKFPQWVQPSLSLTIVQPGQNTIDDTPPLFHYLGDHDDKVAEKIPNI